jgi:acetyl/propionyl-CoA carboxylase alpha subunit
MTRKVRLRPTGSEPVEVELERDRDGRFTCRSDGEELSGELIQTAPGETVIRTGGRAFPVYTACVGRELHLWLGGHVYRFRTEEESVTRAGAAASNVENDIRAPMPGKIVEVRARAGAQV